MPTTKPKDARRQRPNKREIEHALAVAYVNVAVAIAGLEHHLERLTELIRQTAPTARKRQRRA
jgi:hypothetical protein